MQQLIEGLYIGGIEDCDNGLPTIHACKECWESKARSDNPVIERKRDLYLNMVDAREPRYFSPELFTSALEFMDRQDPVVIHCSRGMSRAPSIALFWMSRRIYGHSSFDEAKKWFKAEKFPEYRPGAGISRYLADNWRTI